MSTWAFIYDHPGVDPHTDRVVVERGGLRTILVPVADVTTAPDVAMELISQDGIELLELCGGISTIDAARIIEAVDGRVPVGHVAYAFESVDGAAAYKAKFADAD